MRSQREDHCVARQANANLLLDDGKSCQAIAEFLYLDNDTSRGWYKTYRAGGWDARFLSMAGKVVNLVLRPHKRLNYATGWTIASAAQRLRSGSVSPRHSTCPTLILAASTFWPDWGLSIESQKVFHALHLPKSRPTPSICTSDC